MLPPREIFQLLPSREDRVLTNQIAGAFAAPGEEVEWPPRWWKRLHGEQPVLTLPANNAKPLERAPNPQAVLDRRGYMPQQRGPGYNAELSQRAFDRIDPVGAGYYELSPQERLSTARRILTSDNMPPRMPEPSMNYASEDAWAMYLGLPQQHGSFEVSPFKPSRATNPNTVYLRLPTLWSTLESSALATPDEVALPRSGTPSGEITSRGIARILQFLGDKEKRVLDGDRLRNAPNERAVGTGTALANFTLSKGRDERGPYISYYDIWDLDAPGAGSAIGRSFEVYDRIYYDPRTLEPIRSR